MCEKTTENLSESDQILYSRQSYVQFITMSQNFVLELPTIPGAKICGSDCVFRNSNGSIDALKAGIVSCVGCGTACHMQCHKVTGDLFESVKALPKNNRATAHFGEASNVRLVCDNCLTWLNCEVPVDTKATFQLVFSRIAAKIISEKYVDTPKSRDTSNARKRRLADNGEAINVDAVFEMKDMISKCLNELDNLKKKSETDEKALTDRLDKLSTCMVDSMANAMIPVKDCIISKCDELTDGLKTNCIKIDNLANKIDEKIGLELTMVENGNFNGVDRSPGTVSTPIRSVNAVPRSPRSTIRRRAMMNNARTLLLSGHSETPRTTLFRNSGPTMPTQSGTAATDDVFGPVVHRGQDNRSAMINGNDDNTSRPRAQFKQKNAIYLRFVSSSITVNKMREILQRNGTIAQCLVESESNIEITRLIKKNVPEESFARRKHGVSYRIGCPENIYPIISDPGFWASHWEMRPWNDERQPDSSIGGSNLSQNHATPDRNFLPIAQSSKNPENVNHPPNIPQSTSTDQEQMI